MTSPSTTQSQDAAPVSVDRQDPENGFLAWQDNAYEIDPDDMAAYERALKAEPRLKSVVRVVSALTEFVRPTDELCYGCTWETMIKPLISPLIGWGRGYPPKSAKDPRPEGVSWEIVNLGDVLREADPKVPAETNTEEWLRTSEPYSGFTTVLLNRLYEADPANGCGIRRGGQR